MGINLPTYYTDSTLKAARESDVPLADFDSGMNRGASNAPIIGINTGDYDPKPSDWSQNAGDERIQDSQFLGEAQSGVSVIDATFGDNALAAWAPTTAAVAPDGVIDADVDGTGFASVNRTGKTIPSGVWVWGVANNP